MTHACVSKQIIIGSDNGLSPGRRQAIIWTNDGILLTWLLGTQTSVKIESKFTHFIQENAFENVVWEMSATMSRPQCDISNERKLRYPVPCLTCHWSPSSGETVHVRRRINTLRPRQDGRHIPDDIFKRIFLNANIIFSKKISLKFVPMGLINNIPALVLIMAWRRPGDKPLSEPMMVRSLTYIYASLGLNELTFNMSIFRRYILDHLENWCLICKTIFEIADGQKALRKYIIWTQHRACWPPGTLEQWPIPPSRIKCMVLCRSPVDSPHKGPVIRNFGVIFVFGLNKLMNKNNRFADDLKRNDAHVAFQWSLVI